MDLVVEASLQVYDVLVLFGALLRLKIFMMKVEGIGLNDNFYECKKLVHSFFFSQIIQIRIWYVNISLIYIVSTIDLNYLMNFYL